MKVLHLYSKFVNTVSNVYIEYEKYKDTVKTVVLWCPEELSVGWLKPDKKVELKNYFQNLNVEFIIYTNREIPLFWAFHTLHSNLLKNKQLPVEHSELKKLFITLNGKGWGHRCQFIDKLAELDLLKNNYYSWNLWANEMVGSNYNFKYFDGKVKKLDSPLREKNSENYYNIPEEFKHSLFSVISETSLHNVFFTEKLWHAIYHKRPFLVYGAVGYHQTLKDLGFKLFDSVINYEFDSTDHLGKRLTMFGNELKNLEKYSDSLQELKDSFQPILEHNFYNLLNLLDNSPTPKYATDDKCKYKPILQINTLQKFRKLMK